MPTCCTWTRSSLTWRECGPGRDETARGIRTLPLLADPAQAAARMAGRRARRALGDPEYRVLLAFREHPGGSGRLGRETARSEEHTSVLQSHTDILCRLLLVQK